jgi:type I restriction enzyme S subunit
VQLHDKKWQQINKSILFVPKDGWALDSKYLLFCIRAREKLFQWRSTSTTVPIINKTQCSNLEIPLPSLLEQQVIAARLDEIQELINLRRESLAKLEEYSKSLFLDMFGDPILNPKEWEVKTFRDISKLNQGLQIPISERSIHKINWSYPYITIQYLNWNKDSEFILAPSPSVICNKDDILMTRTGNTWQIIYGIEWVFHNNFFKIDYSRLVLDKMFIVFYLKFEHIQKIILAKAWTSTIPDLNHWDFYKIPIPIPPLTLQQEFESRIERINALKSDYQLSLDKLTELYQATMQHYFG